MFSSISMSFQFLTRKRSKRQFPAKRHLWIVLDIFPKCREEASKNEEYLCHSNSHKLPIVICLLWLSTLLHSCVIFMFILHVQSLSLCMTLGNPMDCCPPGSYVHGIFEARILQRITIYYSRVYSWPGDQICVWCIRKCFSSTEPPGKPLQKMNGRCCKRSAVEPKKWNNHFHICELTT